MLVLVMYDIQATTSAGRRRLHLVAKKCESIGTRVQASVFECLLNASEYRQLEKTLTEIIDPSHDCLRFYNLGNQYEQRITRRGSKAQEYYENPLIFCKQTDCTNHPHQTRFSGRDPGGSCRNHIICATKISENVRVFHRQSISC